MKIDNRAPATVLLFALSLAGTACVAQARHDEALAETRYYQRRYQDLESAMGPIEAENERLKGELAIYQGSGPIEAGVTKDIDERLERLRRITESVGTVEGDVTVLAVEGGKAEAVNARPCRITTMACCEEAPPCSSCCDVS